VKLLLDTNIVIPLEPTSGADIKPETATVTAIVRMAQQAKAQLFVHPAIRQDLGRDENEERRRTRETLLAKYQMLESPPETTPQIVKEIGTAAVGSNDWVDDQLLIAVARDAVSCLVTDDNRIHRKARRLNLSDRVLRAVEAVAMLGAWIDEAPPAPPALRHGPAHALNEGDPFFDSLARDYGREPFFNWLSKVKQDHRPCWSAKDQNDQLEALVITKHETDDIPIELRTREKVLKICTFKVAPQGRGVGLGEQLLKACFGYCYENSYDALFVTLFDANQPELRDLLEEFGFKKCSATSKLGEAMMAKHLDVRPNDGGLNANVLYGPRLIDWTQPVFVVPIQPRFCELLFPERATQGNLLAPRSTSANGIRKAYLCNSPMKSLAAGSVLLFYRSQSDQGVIAVGVVESTLRSSSKDELLVFAGRRTVYSERSINELTDVGRREALAIRFRESRLPTNLIPLTELKANRILRVAPQSITTCAVDEEVRGWLERRTLE
jgi:L-amino acid N-acyltransferase YncA